MGVPTLFTGALTVRNLAWSRRRRARQRSTARDSRLLRLLLRRNDATVTTLWLSFSRSLEICRSCFLIKQAAWKFDCSVNLIGESGGEVMWYGNPRPLLV